jgi:hypothetical protein
LGIQQRDLLDEGNIMTIKAGSPEAGAAGSETDGAEAENLDTKLDAALQADPRTAEEEKPDAAAADEPEEGEDAEAKADEDDDALEGEESDEDDEPEDAIEDGEIEGLPERSLRKINKRIGKLTRRRKEAEERAAAAQARLTEIEAQNATLSSEHIQGAFAMGIPPEYVNEQEVKLLSRVQYLQDVRDWCLENFDGYEGDGSERDPSYTAKDIRRRYAEVDRELQSKSPQAIVLRTERLKQALEDQCSGRELRLRGNAPEKKPAPKPPEPPKVPRAGKTAGKTPPVSAGKPKSGFDSKAVMENPSSDALEREYEKVF